MSAIVIGLSGGTGSGKTTLAKKIVEELGDKAVLVNMDSFYKYQSAPTYEERCKTNYDHPDAFDGDLLEDCIEMLKDGKDVEVPVYDFTDHNRASGPWTHVKAAPVVVVDGVLLFAFPNIVKLLDIKIFVDTPADVRILRRILRDTRDRGRSVESVVDQYLTTVRPMHDIYVEPYKRIADIIIPEGGKNAAAYNLVIDAIRERLRAQNG